MTITLPDFEFVVNVWNCRLFRSLPNFLVVTKKVQIEYKLGAKLVKFDDWITKFDDWITKFQDWITKFQDWITKFYDRITKFQDFWPGFHVPGLFQDHFHFQVSQSLWEPCVSLYRLMIDSYLPSDWWFGWWGPQSVPGTWRQAWSPPGARLPPASPSLGLGYSFPLT